MLYPVQIAEKKPNIDVFVLDEDGHSVTARAGSLVVGFGVV